MPTYWDENSLYPQEQTDEPTPIQMGSGDPEAYVRMYAKIADMSDNDLKIVWDCLLRYDPRNYYDKEGKIGMDDWCNGIQMEMNRRGLPIPY